MIQLPLFATYRVFIVNRLHYMFRLNSHLQVCHIYKNAKTCYYNLTDPLILIVFFILTDPLNYNNKF
jgi:hypothetical protein